MRRAVLAARAAGKTVGLVPTMGALHQGHLSLVEAARGECDVTVVSIFVNPTQFGPREDFQRYPRTVEADLEKLRSFGVDCVFAPEVDEMYGRGHATMVETGGVADPLEGQCRPGHFRGVATVVLKLFNVVPADAAYFGRKDYQQLLVVRQMVRDLDLPIRIVACPIVRDRDGLALSSRNQYLSPAERNQALAIVHSLRLAESLAANGQRDAAAVGQAIRDHLTAAGIDRIDYVAVVDPETLLPVAQLVQPTLVAVAARVGGTRLIDNLLIGGAASHDGAS